MEGKGLGQHKRNGENFDFEIDFLTVRKKVRVTMRGAEITK